jgi:hypothetical protein
MGSASGSAWLTWNIFRRQTVLAIMARPSTNPRWISALILIGAGFFIFALILSAVFDPTIRMLHALQALIYIAVIYLTRKGSAWGYGAGFFIAVLWNYTNLFVTTFIKAGLEQLSILVRTGQLQRPDLVIAVVAAGGHFLLIIACLAAFLRMRPDARRWGQFLGGGVIAVAYFAAIIITTGPQYIPLLRRIFHW